LNRPWLQLSPAIFRERRKLCGSDHSSPSGKARDDGGPRSRATRFLSVFARSRHRPVAGVGQLALHMKGNGNANAARRTRGMRGWVRCILDSRSRNQIGFTSLNTRSHINSKCKLNKHNCLEHIDETISRRSRLLPAGVPWVVDAANVASRALEGSIGGFLR
jgi:hypothetical protein